MTSDLMNAVEYVPEVLVDTVFDEVGKRLETEGFKSHLRGGFERRLTRAWDVAELRCGLAKMCWRSDHSRSFTVRHFALKGRKRTRTFPVRKDDTVNVGGIVAAILKITRRK